MVLKRRGFFGTIAGACVASVAGCSDLDGSSDANENEKEEKLEDQLSYEGEDHSSEGTVVQDIDDVDVLIHKSYTTETVIGDDIVATGIIENTGDETLDFVMVFVRFFTDGRQLNQDADSVNDLEPGERFQFTNRVGTDPDSIDSYEISLST